MIWLYQIILRIWIQLIGRVIDPLNEKWLHAPEGKSDTIGADFFDQLAQSNGWHIKHQTGLLQTFSEIEGEALNLKDIEPQVRHFYEHTADYRLTIWSEWNPLLKPFARLFVHSYCRKAQQFNLPLSVRDTCYGVTNRVFNLTDPHANSLIYAVWIRCSARTEIPMYVSSFSAINQIPGYSSPCIKVCFPILWGTAIVFLRPSSKDGKLVLDSPGQKFGDFGLYITQRTRKRQLLVVYIKAFQELLEVFVDRDGQLKGYHMFKLWWFPVLQLYYQFNLRRLEVR